MHIMLELPTNKPNFLFKNTQDFNQTTHVGPQEPIGIIYSIILYFNYLIFVLHVFKRLHNGISQGGCWTSDFLMKMDISLRIFHFMTVIQYGQQEDFLWFESVSIFFLFQILISYNN